MINSYRQDKQIRANTPLGKAEFLEAVTDAAPVIVARMMGAQRKKSLKESIDDYCEKVDRLYAELQIRDRE